MVHVLQAPSLEILFLKWMEVHLAEPVMLFQTPTSQIGVLGPVPSSGSWVQLPAKMGLWEVTMRLSWVPTISKKTKVKFSAPIFASCHFGSVQQMTVSALSLLTKKINELGESFQGPHPPLQLSPFPQWNQVLHDEIKFSTWLELGKEVCTLLESGRPKSRPYCFIWKMSKEYLPLR